MRVVISAAGTGGHINPGLAIAEKISKENPNSTIVFMGTNRGLENDLVPRAGYELKTIEAYGFKREVSIENFRNAIKTFRSKKDAMEFLKSFRPDIVIGTGGYICVPVIGAALKLNIPTVLHESNSYPGRAVKMYAKRVDKVLTGFENTKENLKDAKNVVFTGTPTKVKKMNLTLTDKKRILKDIGVTTDLPIVFIHGGSQGAKKLNDVTYDLVKNGLNKKYYIILSCGSKQYDYMKDKFLMDDLNINEAKNIKVLPYVYNMDEMLNLADLIVCRSGAMTVTELSIVGKPAIFVPLPSKMANRQEDNAKVLEDLGAAMIINNDTLNYQNLSIKINSVINDKVALSKMGMIASSIEVKNVIDNIYNEIIEVVNRNN